MAEEYESDDPMTGMDPQQQLPVMPSASWFTHCIGLLPGMCRFHCRACCECIGEMDCRSGLVILLPLLAAILGAALGAGLASGLVFRTGWYDNYGWHDARESALPFAVSASILSILLGFYHPRPMYVIRVQRNPPLRCGCALNCSKILRFLQGKFCFNEARVICPRGIFRCGSNAIIRENRRGELGCGGRFSYDCLPLFNFLVALAFGLWSIYLFSINSTLSILPSCLLMIYLGATTRFSRNRLRRLIRIWCGRTTYEIIVDANPFSKDEESEEDEMEWRVTSGSDEDEDSDGELLESGSGEEAEDEDSEYEGHSYDSLDDSGELDSQDSDSTERASTSIKILSGGVKQNKPRARKRGVPEVI